MQSSLTTDRAGIITTMMMMMTMMIDDDDDDLVQRSGNRPCWDHHNNDAENLTPCSETLARRALLEMDDDGDDEGFVVAVTTIMI